MDDWISWKPDYSIGVNRIDEQHKELFRIINNLGNALWDGAGKDAVGDTLKFLTDYVVEHFKTEEEYMQDTSFPGFDEHKKAHDDFVGEVKEFVSHFETKNLATSVTIRIFSRLGDWTRDHVRGPDQEMGKFLSSHS